MFHMFGSWHRSFTSILKKDTLLWGSLLKGGDWMAPTQPKKLLPDWAVVLLLLALAGASVPAFVSTWHKIARCDAKTIQEMVEKKC